MVAWSSKLVARLQSGEAKFHIQLFAGGLSGAGRSTRLLLSILGSYAGRETADGGIDPGLWGDHCRRPHTYLSSQTRLTCQARQTTLQTTCQIKDSKQTLRSEEQTVVPATPWLLIRQTKDIIRLSYMVHMESFLAAIPIGVILFISCHIFLICFYLDWCMPGAQVSNWSSLYQ